MKPLNRKKQLMTSLFQSCLLWAGIFLLGMIYGRCSELNTENTGIALMELLQTIVDNPLKLYMAFPHSAFGWKYAAYGFLFGAISPLIMYNNYLHKKDIRPGKEYGSAKWNENTKRYKKSYEATPRFSVLNENKLTESPNMIMTNEQCLSMDGRKTRRNNNVVVIGGSGSGKSRFVMKPNILQANCSYVITDPSGELLESTRSFLEKAGYTIKVLNLVDMAQSNHYNPLKYIRDEEGVLTMITALMTNTTPKGTKSSDPFWEKAETALLQAVIFYVLYELPESDHNFASVRDLLASAKADEGKQSKLDLLFAGLPADHIAAESYAVYSAVGNGKTAQSIVISALARLAPFIVPKLKDLTSKDDMELGSMGDKKIALFCVTPTADTTFNFLVGILYTQLFETLYHHAETDYKSQNCALPIPVRFLLDEFANIGRIPDFEQKLATMRKYQISCTIVLQAISQLKTIYEKEWETVIANCDSMIFLGCPDNTSVEYISKTLGKETIRARNSSRQRGRQGSSSESYNRIGRELLTPSELKQIDNDYCIYFLRGLEPFFSRKYILENHPNYKYLGENQKEKLLDSLKKYVVSKLNRVQKEEKQAAQKNAEIRRYK